MRAYTLRCAGALDLMLPARSADDGLNDHGYDRRPAAAKSRASVGWEQLAVNLAQAPGFLRARP